MGDETNRIVILEKNVVDDLKRCPVCEVNFTAVEPCLMCSLRIEKEEELGRPLTKQEFQKMFEFLR